MKKLLIVFFTILVTMCCAFCVACDDNQIEPEHQHTYATEWSYDDTYHWHAAICEHTNEVKDKAEHIYIEGVCICGKEEPHEHIYSTEWSKDETYHWHAAICEHTDEVKDKAEHDFVRGECSVCHKKEYSEGLKYSLINNGTERCVTGIGTCTDTEITIPSVYNSRPVTSIGSYAFKNCNSLRNITIPDSVTSIGEGAFSGCSSLESMAIPFVGAKARVTSSDERHPFGYIFGKSSYTGGAATEQNDRFVNLYSTYYIPISLKKVTVLGGYIPYGAVRNCSNVQEIVLGDSVTSIGDNVFANCSSLRNITIPDSVTSIGSYAFKNCNSLRNITIPDSVTSIGAGVFSGCSSLESMAIPFVGAKARVTSSDDRHPFGYIFGTISYTGGAATKQYYYSSSIGYSERSIYYIPTSLQSVTVTGGNILYGAFEGCSSLTSVTIGDNVTTINEHSFYNCSSLTSVTIGDNVTTIDDYSFYNCSSLTSVTMPDSVTSIGESAFEYCSSLTSVTIGNNVTSIDNKAFLYCASLTSITIPDSVTSLGIMAFSGCSSLTSITIPDSVTSIGALAFDGCSIEIATISTGVIGSIPKDKLKAVIINGGTSIGYRAFYDCSSLTSITIPNSVTSIRNYAFEDCSSLTSITIGNSVTSIGEYAFSGCSSLTSINVDEKNKHYKSIDGNLYGNDGKTLMQYAIGKTDSSFIIPNSVTTLGGYAFYNCSSLTSVTIPNSVTSIGSYAFRGCRSLTSITIPNSVTSIGSYAFYNCSSLQEMTLPFVGASLTGMSNTHFGYIFGTSSYSYNSSYVPKSLKKVTILGGYILYRAFYNCSNIQEIVLGDSITSIRNYAFEDCSSLTSITIGNSVTSIGEYAFSGCSSLTSVTIPNSVTSIGNHAFYGCYNLTSVTFKDTSTWYRTTNFTDYQSKTGGTQTPVTSPSQNATYFTSTYYNYYWYKK